MNLTCNCLESISGAELLMDDAGAELHISKAPSAPSQKSFRLLLKRVFGSFSKVLRLSLTSVFSFGLHKDVRYHA